MINIRRIFGLMVVTGTPYEVTRVSMLSFVTLLPGDKVVKLPLKHHIQRNPRRNRYNYNEALAHEWNKHYDRLGKGSAWDRFMAGGTDA